MTKDKFLDVLGIVIATAVVIAVIILLGIKSAERAETEPTLGENYASEIKEICQTYGRENGRMLFEIKKNGKVTKEELINSFGNKMETTMLTMINFTFDNDVTSETVEQKYFDEYLKNAIQKINNK